MSTTDTTRSLLSPWFAAALVVEAALVTGDVMTDQTFTAAYLLAPLALALVERPRPVAVVGVLAVAVALVSASWNDQLVTVGTSCAA